MSERRSKKIRKEIGCGIWRVWGEGMFTINFKKRGARTLRKIILLHFGLVTFLFHCGKTGKVIFHYFRIVGRVHDSQNQLCSTLETSNDSKQFKNNTQRKFKNIISWNLKISQIGNLEHSRTDACRKRKTKHSSHTFLKILNMESISSKNMKCKSWNFSSHLGELKQLKVMFYVQLKESLPHHNIP